jgi:hypothetical protein
MTLSDYRNTPSWQGALDVAPGLIRLAEDLPGSEDMGLGYQIRTLIVELPAAIATDLMHGSEMRLVAVMRLAAVLDLIDRVYPALDTADTRQAVDRLAAQLSGPGFGEQPATTTPPAQPEPTEPAESAEAEPTPEPSQVPVLEATQTTETTHVTVDSNPE